MKVINEREIILDVLLEVMRDGIYSHIALSNMLKKYQYLDKKERAFISRIVNGTLEHMIELDYIINTFSKVKVNKMKPVIRVIVRSAVYQLKYMDSVPNSAICNEAVKLVQKRGFHNLKGFVNGVLRNIERNQNTVEYPKKEDIVNYFSVAYSMPTWILKKWLSSYTSETVEQMLKGFQEEKKMTIRVNIDKIGVKELKEVLEEEGVVVESHPYLSYALFISKFDYLGSLDSFTKGLFYVQDVSSMLVTEIASPSADDYIIDLCSAPGGKSLHMASLLKGRGLVEARDLTPYKVGLIEENIVRTKANHIKAVQMDATIYANESKEVADIVIADLPCSGLGVLGKKKDLKYNITPEGIMELSTLQKSILKNASAYVKKGGTLVYSTCTISREENEDIVSWFLSNNKEYEVAPIRGLLCEELKELVSKEGTLQLLPGIQKCDGFFIAKFVKSQLGV